MDKYHQLYSYITRFLNITESEFDQLKEKLVKKSYRKSEHLIKSGETGTHLYFILKGVVREYIVKDKRQVTTDIIMENTVTGAVSSFFTETPSHYTLEAMEAVETFAISKKNLEELYQKNVKWERFGRLLTSHFLLSQERFILDSLQFTTAERFSLFFENNHAMLQRVSQKHLASYLNIKPETFSRLKKGLQKKQIAAAKANSERKIREDLSKMKI